MVHLTQQLCSGPQYPDHRNIPVNTIEINIPIVISVRTNYQSLLTFALSF